MGDRPHLVQRLRGLDEDQVGPRLGVGLCAFYRLSKSVGGSGISTGDHQDPGVGACLHGCLDLLPELHLVDDLFLLQVTTLLGEHLILQLDRRHPGAYVLLHRSVDVRDVTESRVRVSDERPGELASDDDGLGNHLCHGGQPDVRKSDRRGRHCGARHVARGEASRFDERCGEAVVNPRGDDQCFGREEPRK